MVFIADTMERLERAVLCKVLQDSLLDPGAACRLSSWCPRVSFLYDH